jgi:hypothetical protein
VLTKSVNKRLTNRLWVNAGFSFNRVALGISLNRNFFDIDLVFIYIGFEWYYGKHNV